MRYNRIPEYPLLAASVTASPGPTLEVKSMKERNPSELTAAVPVTLQEVFERLSAKPELSDTRKRDLRSSVAIYGKIVDRPLREIPLDLAAIRKTLDGVVPLQAKVSRKRWANLRSDLAAAIAESDLNPMLKTSDRKLSKDWAELFGATEDRRITNGLSRLARWTSLKSLRPADVDGAVFERFLPSLKRKVWFATSDFSGVTCPGSGTSWS